MLPTVFLQVLSLWMWLNVAAATVALYELGPQPRFWFLLLAAAATWASQSIFKRYFSERRS